MDRIRKITINIVAHSEDGQWEILTEYNGDTDISTFESDRIYHQKVQITLGPDVSNKEFMAMGIILTEVSDALSKMDKERENIE